MENTKEFQVGDHCSMVIGSDWYASKVIAHPTPNTVLAQHVKTKCIDYYAGDYEIFDELDEHHTPVIFTKRRNGRWVDKGSSMRHGMILSSISRHYMDPHF